MKFEGVEAKKPPFPGGPIFPGREIPVRDVFFRRVIEGMRCGIVTVDRLGNVLTVNHQAREILEMEGLLGEGKVEEVFAQHPRLAQVLRDSLEMSYLPNREEMEIRSREDDGRTIGFTISPIPGEEGPQGVALFFKDLTLVERQEEQERLRERLVALGQMAASLAHEIRNPLASIDVTATLLKRRLSGRDEDLKGLVKKITDEVERLNRTVTQGLEFARVLCLERVRQDLLPLLQAALAETVARFSGNQVEVQWVVPDDLAPLPVDGNLFRQVFVNLFLNAFEAMEGRGRLVIEIRQICRSDHRPLFLEVVIADDGPGISPEVRDKIFHPFVTTKKGGSGIGLAMARKIVESHHGLIDVQSTPGTGTVFRVRIPGDEPETPAATATRYDAENPDR